MKRPRHNRWTMRTVITGRSCLLCLCLGLLSLSLTPRAEEALTSLKPGAVRSQALGYIEYREGRLSVNVSDVSADALLERIADQSGLVIVRKASLDWRVSVEFYRLLLHEAVVRILRQRSFALEGYRSAPATGQPNTSRPMRLWVFDMPRESSLGQARGRRGAAPQIAALTALLMSEDWRVRVKAAEDLGALGSVAAVSSLSLAVLDDGDDRVRRAVIAALVSIGGDEAAGVLAVALREGDSWLREAAVEALAETDAPSAIGLVEQAFIDEDEDVREAAVNALASIGGQEATHALSITLEDKEAYIRELGVEALGQTGETSVIPLLAEALEDTDEDVREVATQALADIGGEEAALALVVALDDDEAWLRARAVAALGDIGGATAIRLLGQALTDDEESVREAAADMMAQLRNQIR